MDGYRWMDRQMDGMDEWTDREKINGWQIERWRDRQIDRQIERQINRQMDRQKIKYEVYTLF